MESKFKITSPTALKQAVREGLQQYRGGQQQRQGYDLVPCSGCKGNVRIKVPQEPTPIKIEGTDMITHLADDPAKAAKIEHLKAQARHRLEAEAGLAQRGSWPDGTFKVAPAPEGTWACGVTTVPERRHNGLLLRTLASLRTAGFNDLTLFIDGPDQPGVGVQEWPELEGGSLHRIFRNERIGAVGNWFLAAWELLIRNPKAGRLVLFQDDVIAVSNLRGYLDAVPWPERGYLNLFTFMENDAEIEGTGTRGLIWGKRGWVETNIVSVSPEGHTWQSGRGGLALAFSRAGLETCLTSQHWVRKLVDCRANNPSVGDMRERRTKRLDGGIAAAMNLAGWREYVHAPSLVQHTGDESTLHDKRWRPNLASTFPGEGFDAMELLPPAEQK